MNRNWGSEDRGQAGVRKQLRRPANKVGKIEFETPCFESGSQLPTAVQFSAAAA